MIRSVLDLETLGTAPGCAVLSIGMTIQNGPDSHPQCIQLFLSRKASLDIGLTIDPGTLDWHARNQKPWLEYINVFLEEPQGVRSSQYHVWEYALDRLFEDVNRLTNNQPIDEIWANGANFDFPILRHIANKIGCPIPWSPFSERCFRTVRQYFPEIPFEKNSHNAIEDAMNQHLWLNQALPLT